MKSVSMKSALPLLLGIVWMAGPLGAVFAADPVDYVRQVKPLLAGKCFACHGALRQESGLRLDAASLIRRGGDSGPAVAAGRSGESLLIERVTADADFRMPPAGEGEPLTAAQVALLRGWIDQGAAAPEEPVPPDPREHWAYRPPIRPEVPTLADAPAARAWLRNDIDAFIAAGHRTHGLSPAAPAPQGLLLRRVYLDLTGLPPTRDELHAFLRDQSPGAYERVVDRLLASPLYGERWARHWMDVWRYSDWAGFGNEVRYSQRHLWRWRDWIVESLNADKSYDRMIVEMLADDELAPGDEDAARAAGFLARNWYKFDRNTWLDDTVEHTARAFLATTLNCARCHNHKYDPLTQAEYYRFRAVFEPYEVRTDRRPGEPDVARDGLVRVYDAHADTPTYLFERGDPKRPVKGSPLEPGTPAVLGGVFEPRPVALPPDRYYPALRESITADLVEEQRAAVSSAETALAAANAGSASEHTLAGQKLATARAKLVALTARVAAERAKYLEPMDTARAAALAADAAKAERLAAVAEAEEKSLAAGQELAAAEATHKARDAKAGPALTAARQKVEAAGKALETARQAAVQPGTSYRPLGPTYPQSSTGRRLALARWITDRSNPLTARVAVNHIWLRHFGRPLVENVTDFGLRSPRPEHAELLDYLAVRLMDEGWSMKRLHRRIVLSAAYRQQSGKPKAESGESEFGSGLPLSAFGSPLSSDRLVWRMDPRRMEAEAVRDALLFAAGSLDLRMGGPDIDHGQGMTVPRRSLYFRHAREKQMPWLQTFDAASPVECYRRRESVRPQQALALMNSPLALAQSRLLAGRLMNDPSIPDDDHFITAAFETLLSRAPTDAERAECRRFLDLQARQLSNPQGLVEVGSGTDAVPASADPLQRARENLVLVLFNHNDFVTIR